MVEQNADITALLESLKNSAKGQTPVDNSQNQRIGLRDNLINATRRAPDLSERLNLIAAGQPQAPSGAFGTIGKALVNNPVTKTVLSGMNTLSLPRRAVQASLLELKDAVDSNSKTVASTSDWYSNYTNPEFGGGDLWKGKGWGHRIVGFALDVALDPLTPATLGGTVGPKQLLSAAAKKAAGIELAENVTARAFIGTKYIADADGRNALARAIGKLGGTDDIVRAVASEGRRAVPDEFVKMLGLQDYGIYYFGSRVKVPFSGVAGRMLATGMSKGRLGILRSNTGTYLQNLMTKGGTSGTFNVKDLRIGLSKGTLNNNSRQALALLNADEAERGLRNLAGREGGAYLKNSVGNSPAFRENANSVYEFLDVPEEYWTSIPTHSQREAIKIHNEQIKPWFIDKANQAGIDVGNKVEPRETWFPNKMTELATRFLDNERDPRVANILKWVKVDHTELQGSFTARQFQNSIKKAIKNGEKVDWFGTTLTEKDLVGGIKTFNTLAKRGGFKGDFFETNYFKAMTSYLDDFSTHIGRQEFARSLANEGQDVGEWATQRGIITKEALDTVINAPEKYKNHLSTVLTNVEKDLKELTTSISVNLQPIRATARKASGLSKDELSAVASGAADAVAIGGSARIAQDAAALTTQQSAKAVYEKALSGIQNARQGLSEKTASFFASFKDESLALTIAKGNLDETETSMLKFQQQLEYILKIIEGSNESNDVFKGLQTRLNDDLAKQIKITNESIKNSRNFLDANLQLPGLSDNFEKIITGIVNPKPGLESEIYDIAHFGRNFKFNKNYIDRTTLVGTAASAEEKKALGQIKGLGRQKINYLLNVTESLDTQVGAPGYVATRGAKAASTENALSKIFNASEQINDWVKLRNQLNIGDISENSLRKLDSQKVLSVLTKGMTSTETNNLGAIREAVAWIYLREQLLDPGFATRELQNSAFSGENGIVQRMQQITEHFKLMKIKVTELPRNKDFFKKVNLGEKGKRNWTYYVLDDAGLPKQAEFIVAEKNRPLIEKAILEAEKDLTTIDAVTGRSGIVVAEEFKNHLDRIQISNLDDLIDADGYRALSNTFQDLNDIYQNDNIDAFIKYLDDKMAEPGEQAAGFRAGGDYNVGSVAAREKYGMDLVDASYDASLGTYRELSDFIDTVFSNKRIQGKILQSNNIKGINLKNYEILNNEPIGNSIQRKIVELNNDLRELDKISQNATKGLTGQALQDLSILNNNGVGRGISRLSYDVGVRYLKLENDYALNQIDELLLAHNVPLNATGQSIVTKEVVGKFKTTLENHSRILDTAKKEMERIAQVVTQQPNDQNLHLLAEIRNSLKNPEIREAFETIFPSIVIQSDIRATSTIDNLLLDNVDYSNWINDITNFRMNEMGEAVSPAATPTGGGGMIETGNLRHSADATKALKQNKSNAAKQAASDKFLRSPELQRSSLKTDLLTAGSHSRRIKILDSFIKNQKEELVKLSKSGSDTGTIENLIKSAEELRQVGAEVHASVIEDTAIMASVNDAKRLATEQVGAGGRSKRTALRIAANSEDSLNFRSVGNLFSAAIDNRATTRRTMREFFSNLLGGHEYANPLAIGEAYAINKTARKGGTSLRIVRPEESFFGRSEAQIAQSVDHIKTMFPDATTPEAISIEANRAFVARLNEKMTILEAQIKAEPKLMKLVLDAQTELDKLSKQSAKLGGNLERRITSQAIIKAWEDSQSKVKFPTTLPFIDRGAYTAKQADKLNKWVVAKRQLVTLEGTTTFVIADREKELKEFSKLLSSVKITEIQDEIGNLRWGTKSANIAQLDLELNTQKKLLNQAIVNNDEQTQQFVQNTINDIQAKLGQAGHSGGVRTWTADEMNLLKTEVSKMGVIRQGMGTDELNSLNPDIYVMEKRGIASVPDVWNKNYDKLLARAQDDSKSPLMFLVTDENGSVRAYDIRKQVDVNPIYQSNLDEINQKITELTVIRDNARTTPGGSTPRNLQEQYAASFVKAQRELDVTVAARDALVRKNSGSSPADKLAELRIQAMQNKSSVTILEPKTIAEQTVDAAGQTVIKGKPVRLIPGTQYQPEDVWVGIEGRAYETFAAENQAKLKKTSDLTTMGADPVGYHRLTDFNRFKIKSSNDSIKYIDGTDFKFTPADELVISADWSNKKLYDVVRTESSYNKERFRLFTLLSDAEERVTKSKRVLGLEGEDLPYGRSQPKVKGRLPHHKGGGVASYGTVGDIRRGAHDMAVRSAHALQLKIEELDMARTAIMSRTETHRKVSWLYHYFDNVNNQQLLGLGVGDKGVKPTTVLSRLLKPYQHPDSKVNLLVPEAEQVLRKDNIERAWLKSPESKQVNRAEQLRATMRESEQNFSEDNLLLADIARTTRALESAKNNVGTKSEELQQELENILFEKGVTLNTRIPIMGQSGAIEGFNDVAVTPKALRKGIGEVDKQTEEQISKIAMLDTTAPQPNLWQHKIAVLDDAFSISAYNKTQKEILTDFNKSIGRFTDQSPGNAQALNQIPIAKKEMDKLVAQKTQFENEYKKLQQAMGADRTKRISEFDKGRADIVTKQGVLARAQTAFDSATIAITENHVLKAQSDLNAVEEVLRNLKQFKGKKITEENLPNIAKEMDVFLKHVQPLLKSVAGPDVDKTIQGLTVKYINSYTEYLRTAADLGEMEQLASLAQGIGLNVRYIGSKGKVLSGADSKDISPMFRGALNEEFLLGFNKGFVELSKNFPNVGVAPEIAEMVHNVHRLSDPAVLSELNRFLGRYTQFFKAYATLTPGFHVRNGISNGFMLFAAGGNAKYLMEGLGLSRIFNEAINQGLSVKQFLETVPKEQRFYVGEAIKASSQSGGGNSSELLASLYSKSRFTNNVATRTSRKVGANIETHSRFMLAYDGIKQGMDANTAAARVRRYLIDYEDLSTLDKSMRQIVPFWMWTSRNLPMQVQNIWMNPKAYQIYSNLKRNFTDENSENDNVPIWLKEMGAFKLPFGQDLYATPDMGFNRIQSDINMLQDPRRFLSNVNPLLRLPIELTGDRQLFSNKRFSTTPVEVTGGVGSAMQPLMEALGYGETGSTGKKFVNDKAFYALRNLLPQLGQAERFSPSTPTGQQSGIGNQQLGYLGIPVRQITPEMKSSELKRREFEMQGALRNYLAVNGQ